MNAPARVDLSLPSAVGGGLSVDERILLSQTDSIIHTGLSAWVGSFLVALGFWMIFYEQTHQAIVLVWAAIIHSLQFVRLFGMLRYARTPDAQRNPVLSANRYCNILLLTGVTWGLAPWMFFPVGNLPLTSLMMLILLGMSSGGMASLAPYRRGIFSYIVPMLLSLSGALLWQGGSENVFLALCALLYLYVNLKFGLQQNDLLSESLRARYEKEELAKRLEEQVRIGERANIEKTRFLASASHDLRQPLHSIGLFGAALMENLKSTPNEALVNNLMLCINALEESFTVMLDVSKLDAGVVDYKPQPISLSYLFQRLEKVFERQAESQGLALRFKSGGKWVYGDPILMERLLSNLIHNSLKFTKHGGVLLVARGHGNKVSIEVWDSGIGIEANELPLIFDEFYQLYNPERDRSKGLGMGLSIVQRLSRLMDMPLKVYSRVGRGTVFKLQMRRAEVQQDKLSNAARLNTGQSKLVIAGKRVLVVDDEERVLSSTAAILRLYGMHVETAEDIQQAKEIALRQNQHLDIVITDLRLRRGEDGISLANDLNAMLGRKVPVLLVTGDIAPERIQHAQLSGLTVLYKPVNIDDLISTLNTLLI